MNRNFVFTTFFFFVSVTVVAQNLDLLKAVSEGVFNRQKIAEIPEEIWGFAGLLGQKKSYSETMIERRKQIKSIRQQIAEAREYWHHDSKSQEELESELSLLVLSRLPAEESEQASLSFEILEAKPTQSQSWQVPGIRAAPEAKSSESFGNSDKIQECRSSEVIINPFNKAPDSYKGPRKPQLVKALKWESKPSGFMKTTFQKAHVHPIRAADGWRLPTVWELYALYEQKNILGDDLNVDSFWSGTEVHDRPHYYWCVSFKNGKVKPFYERLSCSTRLVRDSNSIFQFF